jgi:hypothetical protein
LVAGTGSSIVVRLLPFCWAASPLPSGGWWWGSGSESSTMRRRAVVRLAATLMFAGWDRMSGIRRKLPLT